MNPAEYILGLSDGLGMVIAWIHLDREDFTVGLKEE